jgi:hypothetical protein
MKMAIATATIATTNNFGRFLMCYH